MGCKRTVAVRLLTEQSEFSDWRPSLRTTAQWRAAPGEWPVPSAENRYAEWVDLVGRLLERPLTELPVKEIALQLRRSTDATAVSYNWRDHPGRPGVRAWLPDWTTIPSCGGRAWSVSHHKRSARCRPLLPITAAARLVAVSCARWGWRSNWPSRWWRPGGNCAASSSPETE